MAFTRLNRPRPPQKEPFHSTRENEVRLASHRPYPGGGSLVIIWLGLCVAEAIGLTEKRETVALFVDDEGPIRRIAIRRDAGGDFRASRRLAAWSVHLDMVSSDDLLGHDGYVRDTISAIDVVIDNGTVSFPFPTMRRHEQERPA